MIIVRLTGGLGNQLFQYATGLRLALRNNSPLTLDVSAYSRDSKRSYALSRYVLDASVAIDRAPALFRGRERVRDLKHRLYTGVPPAWRRWHWLKQQTLRFEPRVLLARGDIYLDGSWQSERYFSDIASRVQADLALREGPTNANAELARKIESCQCAVSVHVRRGDYVSDATTRAIHDVCSAAYYERAIASLAEESSEVQLFVFSDDPKWVSENLRFSVPATVVDENHSSNGHDDLWLMSLCRHHVIANSSFSWWGAWLSPWANKKVFAPNQWFRCEGYDIHEIVPSRWTLVETGPGA